MPQPRAYITRRIPHAALEIVAAACDYTLWDSDDQPVPKSSIATLTPRRRTSSSPGWGASASRSM